MTLPGSCLGITSLVYQGVMDRSWFCADFAHRPGFQHAIAHNGTSALNDRGRPSQLRYAPAKRSANCSNVVDVFTTGVPGSGPSNPLAAPWYISMYMPTSSWESPA